MTVFDATCVAVNVRNAGAALEGDHASGVGVLNVADVYDFPATGQVSINGDVYDYTAVDDETDTVTLSGVTTAAYDDGTPVWVDPLAPVRYATVMIGSDQGSQNALVPHHLVALLDEQMQDTPDGFPVRVEPVSAGRMGWQVVEVPGQSATHNASTVPIVVTTENGESVRIDGDGITTYTDDPVRIWAKLAGSEFNSVAVDGDYVFGTMAATDDIHKYSAATGEEVVGGGFPIVGTFSNGVAADGGYVYASDSAFDVRKYDAATGAPVGGGFPIVGTFGHIAVVDGFIYVDDNASGIRKFNAATGVENLSGFPILGSFIWLAAADGYVYAIDSVTRDIRKYDATTGVENVSGFPIAGTFDDVAAADGKVYGRDTSGDVHQYDATTGEENTTTFPLGGSAIAAADGALYTSFASTLYKYNTASGYESVLIDSSDGTMRLTTVTASDLTATGFSVLEGPASVDHLLITTTRATRTAAQNVGHNTTTVVQADTWAGSGTNGDTDFYEWDTTNHRYNILVAGVYDLSAMGRLASNATGTRSASIRVNGAGLAFDQVNAPSVSFASPIAASGVPLSVGDTVDLTLFHTAGAGVNLSCAGSWLNIKRVGALAA